MVKPCALALAFFPPLWLACSQPDDNMDAGVAGSSSSTGGPVKLAPFYFAAGPFFGVVQIEQPVEFCPLGCFHVGPKTRYSVVETIAGGLTAEWALLWGAPRYDGDGGDYLERDLDILRDYGLSFPIRAMVATQDFRFALDAGPLDTCGFTGATTVAGIGVGPESMYFERDGGWLVAGECLNALYCGRGTASVCSTGAVFKRQIENDPTCHYTVGEVRAAIAATAASDASAYVVDRCLGAACVPGDPRCNGPGGDWDAGSRGDGGS